MSVGQIRIMERWGTLFEPWGAATGHILWPFWPKIAIFGHRHSQQPQMGWTLVEQGWTLYFTSGGVSLDPFCPPKMALGGPRTPQKWPEIAILGHRQSQQPQRHWKWQCQWQCHLKFTLKDPWIPWYPWNNHFCSFTKIFPYMIVTILGQKRPFLGTFGAQKGRFWAILGPHRDISGCSKWS